MAAASTTGIDPTDMLVFNNEVLFNRVDADGLSETELPGQTVQS